jgi:hypothetical protein
MEPFSTLSSTPFDGIGYNLYTKETDVISQNSFFEKTPPLFNEGALNAFPLMKRSQEDRCKVSGVR